ncbi:R3H and coiled-coil domain-containing protein 1 isoform X2 [Myiozetetes cayanensis]|uniref:R3H and coiled-coil domain-containing protein 1 isoform X2 n=1 Tax=Myiozetetes cayanensis TaxID=478635 RepID=UPI002160A27B|nr:R3H and coiled-coil domain-containing protein 1 isoform X2 [Myiozetetes cayanensis]
MEREEPGWSGRSRDRAQAPHRHPLLRPGLADSPPFPTAATLALRPMDGVFLSPNEDEFVGRISEELEHFMEQGQHHRVLLFPPLSSRLRYLIHRTVENMDLLSSFSVGEGWRRRTVICHSAVRLPNETSDQKPGPNPPRPHRPAQPWGRGGRGTRPRHGGDIHGDTSRACVGSGRISRPPRRKPDKALYVPKVVRKKANWRERDSPGEAGGDAAQGDEICPKNSTGDAREELGKSEEGPGGVPVALGKQQEPGEGSFSGKTDAGSHAERPPCGTNVPSLGNSNDSSEQESRDKDCSDSFSSGHSKHPPSKAEEQDLRHDNAVVAEGSEFLRDGDQTSRDSGVLESGKTSLPESRGGSCCPDPAVAESLGLENQDKGNAAAAKSLESSGNLSAPQEQGKVPANFSAPESQDRERPSATQNPLEARREPLAAAGLVAGGDPSAPEEQGEHWGDAGGGKVPLEEEEEEEEPSDVSDALWRELRLSAGDREERGSRQEQSSLEDDCTAELMAEIVGNLTVKDISIERISVDYSSYGKAQVSEGDFGHVTEIYDFPSSLKTEDLMEMFSDFHESGFKIQWVDDTHALGIFSSPSTASQALGRRYPCLKIRPLIHASKQSKLRALQRPSKTRTPPAREGAAPDGHGRGQETRVPRPGLEAQAAGRLRN